MEEGRAWPSTSSTHMSACSSLGAWLAEIYPDMEPVCVAHDYAYADGGDARDRLIADLEFFLGLLVETDMPAVLAEQVFHAVRIFGGWGNHWNGGPGYIEHAVVDRGETQQQG